MLYLLAAIGALTVATIFWRLMKGGRISMPSPPQRSHRGPDDDPDFLRKLDEQRRKRRQEDRRRQENDES